MSWLAKVSEALEASEDKEPTMGTMAEKLLASRRKSMQTVQSQVEACRKEYEAAPAGSGVRAVLSQQMYVFEQRLGRLRAEVKALEESMTDARQLEVPAAKRK